MGNFIFQKQLLVRGFWELYPSQNLLFPILLYHKPPPALNFLELIKAAILYTLTQGSVCRTQWDLTWVDTDGVGLCKSLL